MLPAGERPAGPRPDPGAPAPRATYRGPGTRHSPWLGGLLPDQFPIIVSPTWGFPQGLRPPPNVPLPAVAQDVATASFHGLCCDTRPILCPVFALIALRRQPGQMQKGPVHLALHPAHQVTRPFRQCLCSIPAHTGPPLALSSMSLGSWALSCASGSSLVVL